MTNPTENQKSAAECALANGHAFQAGFGMAIQSWDEDRFLYLLSTPSDPDSFYAIDANGKVAR